jgi:hypothetical protein
MQTKKSESPENSNLTIEDREELISLAKKQWPKGIVLKGDYTTLTDEYLCQVKTPPLQDRLLIFIKSCKIISLIKNRAVYIEVPKHYKKFFITSGIRIHQNFFVSEKYLGRTLWLDVKVSKKISKGKKEFVIDYTLPGEFIDNDLLEKRGYILKLGTPKELGEKIIKIAHKNYITFNKYFVNNFLN